MLAHQPKPHLIKGTKQMNISLIGCFINLISNYEERLRRCRELIEDSDIEDDSIKETLLDGSSQYCCGNRYQEDSFEDMNEFFNVKDIGKTIIHDLFAISDNQFDKVEAFMVDTEEKRQNLKTLTDLMG